MSHPALNIFQEMHSCNDTFTRSRRPLQIVTHFWTQLFNVIYLNVILVSKHRHEYASSSTVSNKTQILSKSTHQNVVINKLSFSKAINHPNAFHYQSNARMNKNVAQTDMQYLITQKSEI
mmetsp:Transcript_12771/g.14963  ORF Transcript_12771/g.14963 Transcript_12771/m.14963 type:complete len:120 (+) Transcript_12771:134-493(+)